MPMHPAYRLVILSTISKKTKVNYSDCLQWLFTQLPMYQRQGAAAYKANLNNTWDLMMLLKNPHLGFKSIHIAGTNGKGSTAHMLAAVFQQAGYKTGLYTSPHLVDFRERIKINGLPIPEQSVLDFVQKHKSDFSKMELSFFEMTVGMAFDYFAEQQIDIAIVETGLGGRLDSTNVLSPELSIITNISLDHTQFLGNTLEQIAMEKAGIIKENTPVLIGELQEEIFDVFKETAAKNNSSLFLAGEKLAAKLGEVNSDLKGSYQRKNLQTTLGAIHLLEKSFPDLKANLHSALSQTAKLTGLRGRWETLSESPLTIADTAHNLAGITEVVDQLKKYSYRQLHIVWGMVADKNTKEILRLLPKSAIYYFCAPSLERAKNAVELQREGVQYGLSGKAYDSVLQAFEMAQNQTQADDLIFIGGSTFVVAEILS